MLNNLYNWMLKCKLSVQGKIWEEAMSGYRKIAFTNDIDDEERKNSCFSVYWVCMMKGTAIELVSLNIVVQRENLFSILVLKSWVP